MKNIVFGNSDFAHIFYESAIRDGMKIDAFTVNGSYMKENSFRGVPIVAYEELRKESYSYDCQIYLCVGYSKMNEIRESIYYQLKEDGYKIGTYIHSSVICSTKTIGEGNIIFEGVIIGNDVIIGKCNVFYPATLIAHDVNLGDFNYFSVSSSIAGKVEIGNKCFFGSNITTKDHIKIGNSVLIGAAAYVSHNLNDEQVIVPSRSVILNGVTGKEFL